MAEIERVGVVGAGTMGASIAQLAAMAGLAVRLYDVADGPLDTGLSNVWSSLERFVRRGALDQAAAEAVLGRIAPTTDLAALGDVGFVIEAAPERLDLKRTLFAELDRICPAQVVLASNTSSLSITEMAAATSRPERVVGMHFFNPPVVLPLVEVARTAQSASWSVETAVALARRFGKTPVEVADTPGFIVNRVARPYYLESLRILSEGLADHRTIDRVMKLGGFKMGPFELLDLVGIDVNFAVSQSVYEQTFFEPRFRPQLLQQQMVRANLLGRKTGRGFYVYDPPEAPPEPPAPPAFRAGPVAVLGEGGLAAALRTLVEQAGLPATDDLGAAGLVLVAAEGYLEVRRLALRNALERVGPRAVVLAHCAPWTVTETAATLRRSEAVVGFSIVGEPASTRLVEVAAGLNSAEPALEQALACFGALGKEPVRVGDGPGLVFGRVISALANEAASALDDDVASGPDIDTAMKLGVAYPLGPLEWADRLGLDLIFQTLRALQQDYGADRYRPAIRLRRLVQSGRLGRQRGGGFLPESGSA
jgi:3-hydroxybutyryl-CoA dehydrogenase